MFFAVGARLAVLWLVINPCTAVQASFALPLCVGAWAAVEVPRYLFYVFALLKKQNPALDTPYALQWLRYNMFIVLYPAGISGEVGCFLFALPQVWGWGWALGKGNPLNFAYSHFLFLLLLLALYLPGAPLMVGHMWRERGKWMAKQKGASQKGA